MKTIRLLATYNGFKRGDIIALDDAIADQLLLGGVSATLDLTGGSEAFQPSPGTGLSSGSSLPQNQTLTAGETTDVLVPSGVSLGLNSSSDIAGTWRVVNPDGTTASPKALTAGQSSVGVFVVDTKVRFSVTFGTLVVKAGVVAGSLTSQPLYFVPVDPATGQAYKIEGGDGGGGTGPVDSGSHTYGYANGLLTTDTWTVGGITKVKTYTYTNGQLSGESDWVPQ